MKKDRPFADRPSGAAAIVALLLALVLSVAGQAGEPGSPSLGLDPTRPITQYAHEAWTTEHGLPQSTVAAIEQTPDGYLWLGTRFGLARFDGVRFTVFHPRNHPGLVQADVRSLLVDRQGALWVGTHRGGLSRLKDGRFRAFVNKDGIPDHFISCLHEDPTGQLWVGTGGGLARRLPDGRFAAVAGLAKRINALLTNSSGELWIGADSGLFVLRRGRIVPYRQDNKGISVRVRALCADGGVLWVGTSRGLIRLAEGRQTLLTVNDGLSSNSIGALLKDSGGVLWIGAWGGGINRYHNGEFSSFGSREGLSNDVVVSLKQDREGSLWIGTDGGGLNRFRNPIFTTWSRSEGFPAGTLYTVCGDEGGGLWMGTNGRGLIHFKDGRSRCWTMKDGLPSDMVLSTWWSRSGRLWIGTRDGLACLENGRIDNLAERKGFPRGHVRALFEDRAGQLWISSDAGLHCLSEGRLTRVLPELPDWLLGNLFAIRESDDGAIWLASVGGLRRYKDGRAPRYSVPEGLSHLVVTALHIDGNDVWCGTEEGGLNLWRDGKITIFPLHEPAPIQTIFSILDDGRGYLWLGTCQGIVRLKKQELLDVAAGGTSGYRVRLFDQHDGLKTREMTGGGPGGWKTADGRLWFASAKGLVMIDPSRLHTPESPEARIESVVVGDVEDRPEDGRVLPPGTARLAIHYTAMSLLAAPRTRFRYKLEGLDKDWIDAGTRRVVYYTHVPAGNYRFVVQAGNEDGDWQKEGASWSFRVRQHFYETVWFYSLCAGGVLLVGLAGLRLRTRQLRHGAARLTRIIEERTRELQQEIADRRQAELALRASRDELEQRVAERTTELESVNESLQEDIAERKRAEQALLDREEQIRASLREKEALLKEIHHRVKNNLQIIISLLNLQAAQTKEPAILNAFAESENRVRSMALVHESLYHSGDLARIMLAPHVQSLCEHLYRCYGVDTRRIALRTSITEAALDLDRAIPCGLIINELVSNALKYAFPDGRSGYVSVALDYAEGRYTLVVEDNGVGLPAGFDFRRTESLGLQLVCGLTEQIGGTIEHCRKSGASFRIEFGGG